GTRILGTQENPKLYDLVLFWYKDPRNLKELLTEFKIENREFENWIDIIPVVTDGGSLLPTDKILENIIDKDWFTEQKRQVDYELSEELKPYLKRERFNQISELTIDEGKKL
ncbi:33787_t:CDS:2, partial [Racocetra persica]